MSVVIPMSRIYDEVQANLINNNAIDNVQFDIDRQSLQLINMPTDEYWRLTYSSDKSLFVAVSTNNVVSSVDGTNFALGNMPTGKWSSIAYGNGLFVAVGENAIAYSTDGINFTLGNIPSGKWYSVTYGNGKFVAVTRALLVADVIAVAYSTDGRNFTQGTIPDGVWEYIGYGNGKFVTVGVAGRTAYSTDGINFTLGNIPSGHWTAVTYSNDIGKFVAIGNNVTAYSTDGITFTQGTIPSGNWSAIAYGNGKFVAVTSMEMSSAAAVSYSTDGINFTLGVISDGIWLSIAYSDNLFVTTGRHIVARSSNGINFSDTIVVYNRTFIESNNGTDNPFLIKGNELLTTNTTYQMPQPFPITIPMINVLATAVFEKWLDGRMSVRFTCDYSVAYLDENGNPTKYTGTNGQLLNMEEEIIVWDDRMGRNEPLLKNVDGSARKFKVTSNEMNWDGVVLQTIDALEVK